MKTWQMWQTDLRVYKAREKKEGKQKHKLMLYSYNKNLKQFQNQYSLSIPHETFGFLTFSKSIKRSLYVTIMSRTSFRVNPLYSLSEEVVYVTIENPAFCLFLYLTGVHFRGELQPVGDVSEQKLKS